MQLPQSKPTALAMLWRTAETCFRALTRKSLQSLVHQQSMGFVEVGGRTWLKLRTVYCCTFSFR
jgi:hypothetical protein